MDQMIDMIQFCKPSSRRAICLIELGYLYH